MSIIQIIKEQMNMTERERDICRYILENPEKIEEMSSRELGHATFTSAASVTRFCQKIGVKGFPEFKMQFVRELRTGGMEDVSAVTMSERENVVTMVRKAEKIQRQAVEETNKELSPINTLLLSQSIFKLPLISTGPPAGSFRFDVRLMMALILAFTSKMLNGFVI